MKKSLGLLSVLIALLSCNKESNQVKKTEKKASNTIVINKSDFHVDEIPSGCYFVVNKNDTTFVTVDDNLGTITGQIEYTKDSIVQFTGFAAEDTLKLEVQYKITPDSIRSKDLWFLRQYGNLYEGTGKRNDDGTYLHPKFIKYNEGIVYKPIDCKEK